MKQFILIFGLALLFNIVAGRAVSKKEEKKTEEHHEQGNEDVSVSQIL